MKNTFSILFVFSIASLYFRASQSKQKIKHPIPLSNQVVALPLKKVILKKEKSK